MTQSPSHSPSVSVTDYHPVKLWALENGGEKIVCGCVSGCIDYTSFGMTIPGKSWTASGTGYRWGFQAQESDNELFGDGNASFFKYRISDNRIGRFFAVDPLTKKFPHYSPYQFGGNKCIAYIELEGLEDIHFMHIHITQGQLILDLMNKTEIGRKTIETFQNIDPNVGATNPGIDIYVIGVPNIIERCGSNAGACCDAYLKYEDLAEWVKDLNIYIDPNKNSKYTKSELVSAESTYNTFVRWFGTEFVTVENINNLTTSVNNSRSIWVIALPITIIEESEDRKEYRRSAVLILHHEIEGHINPYLNTEEPWKPAGKNLEKDHKRIKESENTIRKQVDDVLHEEE